MAVPGDAARATQFFEFREAAPEAVKRRVALAKERVHPGIQKTAADMIVPFDRFREMMEVYREGYGGADSAMPSGATCRTGTFTPTWSREASRT